MLAISPWLYVGFDTLPQAAEEFAFPAGKAFRLMAAAILAGAGMYVVVLLATGVVLPWRELVAGEPVWATGATVRASLGAAGVAILSVAVVTAIFTGINGFFMASSRLLFSMGRARLLPPWFGTIDPARGTPRNALLFTGAVSLLAPWFGREVIVWVVDMAAVGTACGYLYTCLAAFSVTRHRRARVEAVLGALLSAGFLVLLCVPGMPGSWRSPRGSPWPAGSRSARCSTSGAPASSRRFRTPSWTPGSSGLRGTARSGAPIRSRNYQETRFFIKYTYVRPHSRPFWVNRIERAWDSRNIVWLSGARRLGKTVLSRQLPDARYFNCDLPSVRDRLADPEAFFAHLPPGSRIVLDEVHRAEDPAGLLKIAADAWPGIRVLATGSSTLYASRRFSDSLVGRKWPIRFAPVLWRESPAGPARRIWTDGS